MNRDNTLRAVLTKAPIVLVDHSDLGALVDFGRRVFERSFGHLNTPENMQAYLDQAYTLQQFSKEHAHPESRYYMIRHQDRIIAYMKINWGEAQIETFPEKSLEIQRIYVDHDYHGYGLGRRLMEHSEHIAQDMDCEYIWLGVWEQNPDSIAFYQSQGYSIFDYHIFPFGNEQQKDWLMRKWL